MAGYHLTPLLTSRCEGGMQLLVHQGDSTRLRTASLGDTVGELLARWAPAAAPSESRLSVGGRPLKASWTLSRCGVRHGATLQLMPRMRGGTGMGSAPSWGTGPGVVLPVFEAYQAARIEFATELAKLVAPTEQTNTGAGIPNASYEVDGTEKVLASLEGIDVLAPQIVGLAADVAPQVRQVSMLAIGRMCALSDNLHGKLAQPELLAETIKTIANAASPELLKASIYLLQSSVQTSAEAARLAVDAGALPSLCERLEDADAQTKAAATWVLGAIASHDAGLAASVADAGALTPLMLCLKEPSLPLRRIALSCFGSVGKHDQQLAEMVQKEGAPPPQGTFPTFGGKT